MKKFRTVASVIIMVIAGIVGFFIGAFLNEPMAGTILFSMIAGIACIVYAIDNHEEQGKFEFEWMKTGEKVVVKDPLYGQKYTFPVYKVNIQDKEYAFAAGEFSNSVFGFYIEKYQLILLC